MKAKKIVNISCIFAMAICGIAIIYLNISSSENGLGNAGITTYPKCVADKAEELTKGIESPLEKANILAEYISKNYIYEDNKTKTSLHTYFYEGEIEETFTNKKGNCRDFARLYASMCRSQNIQCYVVGAKGDSENEGHAWNRVCIDGKWYHIDITLNISLNKANQEITKLTEVPSADAPYKDFKITEIL